MGIDSESGSSGDGIVVKGTVKIFNTFESFKTLDKGKYAASLFRERKNIWSTSSLYEFHMICYPDLKKNTVIYWLVFPTFAKPRFEVVQITSKPTNKETIKKIEQNNTEPSLENEVFYFRDMCNNKSAYSWPLRNFLLNLWSLGCRKSITVECIRKTDTIVLTVQACDDDVEFSNPVGWYRNEQGKLQPRFVNLSVNLDAKLLEDQASRLNLELMKWRVAPQLDLQIIRAQRVLVLGAGTLGCNVIRCLLGWGVRHFTVVDNGNVRYSNPVRQNLYTIDDCAENGKLKCVAACEALKQISPSAVAKPVNLSIPMLGHRVIEELKTKEATEKLWNLIKQHDVVFLLTDSRESRWLPTVMATALQKLVINSALGFDSYVVMRHGVPHNEHKSSADKRLGCYFCNDIVAPADSQTNITLDQQCTVTRPGLALIASALAVEMFISILQHPEHKYAPISSELVREQTGAHFASFIPHQIRGYLSTYSTVNMSGIAYDYCSACSKSIVDYVVQCIESDWPSLCNLLSDSSAVEKYSGLAEVQQKAQDMVDQIDMWDDDDEF